MSLFFSRHLKYRAAILGGSSPLQSHALLTGLSWRSHHGAEPNSWAGPMYDHSRSTPPTTVRSSLPRTIRFARPRSSQISLNLQRSYFALTKSCIRDFRTLNATYLLYHRYPKQDPYFCNQASFQEIFKSTTDTTETSRRQSVDGKAENVVVLAANST
jgi:hypothetical protein